MSQHTIVITYVCSTRRRRLPSVVRDDEWVYQLWIVTETRLAELEEVAPGTILSTTPVIVAEWPGECLREALAKSAVNPIEGAIWGVWQSSDDLTLVQATNFLINLSDSLHGAVQSSLGSLAVAVGVPAPVNLVSADVMATLMTGPIEEPIEDLEHGLELAGILAGFVTGMHPLVMICMKYLIHDEINSALAELLNNALDAAFKCLGSIFGTEIYSMEAAPDIQGAGSITAEQDQLRLRRLDVAMNGPETLREPRVHGKGIIASRSGIPEAEEGHQPAVISDASRNALEEAYRPTQSMYNTCKYDSPADAQDNIGNIASVRDAFGSV